MGDLVALRAHDMCIAMALDKRCIVLEECKGGFLLRCGTSKRIALSSFILLVMVTKAIRPSCSFTEASVLLSRSIKVIHYDE